MPLTLSTDSPEETEALGHAIGLAAGPGLLVALSGDLGAGKTLLTQGIARGLDVPNPRYVCSPTFTLHRMYQGRLTLHHMDFYRLGAEAELEDLGLDEALGGAGIAVVEWPDNFLSYLGPDRLDVHIDVAGETKRTIRLDWQGERASAVGAALSLRWGKGESA